MDAADFVRATGNTVWWGSDEPRVESFGAGSLGWQVRRGTFDAVLLAEAEHSGARVVRRAVVRDVTRSSGADAHQIVHPNFFSWASVRALFREAPRDETADAPAKA